MWLPLCTSLYLGYQNDYSNFLMTEKKCISVSELKNKLRDLNEKYKNQKESNIKLIKDNEMLQNAIKSRDQAIDSRDEKINELIKRCEELSEKVEKKSVAGIFNELQNQIVKGFNNVSGNISAENSDTNNETNNGVENEIKFLKDQLVSYENLKNDNQSLLLKYKESVDTLEQQKKELNDRISDLEKAKFDGINITEEMVNLINENSLLKEKIRELEVNSSSLDIIKEENKLLNKKVNDYHVQLQGLNEKLKRYEITIKENEELKLLQTKKQYEIFQINGRLLLSQRQCDDKETIIQSLENDKKLLDTEISNLKYQMEQINDSSKTVFDLKNDENSALISKIDQLTSDISQKEYHIESLNSMLESKIEELKINSDSMNELNSKIENIEKQNSLLNQNILKLQSEVRTANETASDIEIEKNSLKANLDKVLEENYQLKLLINTTNASVVKIEKQLNEKDKRIQLLEEKDQDRISDTADLQNAYEVMKKQFDSLQNSFNKERSDYDAKIQELKKEIETAKELLSAKDAKIKKLSKKRESTASMKKQYEKKILELENNIKNLQNKPVQLTDNEPKPTQVKYTQRKLFSSYLQRVLIQFFIQDGKTRAQLIPVILNLVECDQEIIKKAQKTWTERNAFGLFHK